MNEIRAVVRRSGEGCVWVETGPAVSCTRCQGGGGCSSVSISRLFCSPSREFRVESQDRYEPGERVVLAMPDDQVLRAAMLGYGLPVVGLLVGAACGTLLFDASVAGEGPALLLGVAGFVLALLVARRSSAALARPVLLRRVAACESAPIAVHPSSGQS